jgi:hypothetical protein
MSVRRGTRSIELTSLEDNIPENIAFNEIYFSGDGMTTGQFLALEDEDGHRLCRRPVEAARETAILVFSPNWVRGLRVKEIPDGTVSIFVSVR